MKAISPSDVGAMIRTLGVLIGLQALALAAVPPNVVIVFADDLGYGDLGCYGGGKGATPNLDQLATEGRKFTRFYVSSPVCSASRAALLTGCYHARVGIHGALGPKAETGLHPDETTLAEMLKAQGYATGIVGKWHLGSTPEFLPARQGFDEWLGLPYSNDMWLHHPEAKPGAYPPLPLYDGERVVEAEVTPDSQATLPRRYAERAVQFIQRNKSRPFFLYFAPNMPHVPLFAGEAFRGKSERGLYGDVLAEIDWSVGEVLRALKEANLAENTLVIFTSDNGPWLCYGEHSGSSGSLREGKGTCWEGGVRVPCLMRWPGTIPAASECAEPLMTIDLLPTIARITGAKLPGNRLDGRDAWPLLTGERGAKSPQEAYYFYYENNQLQALVSGRWKVLLPHTYRSLGPDQPKAVGGQPVRYQHVKIEQPQLYDLESDPAETKDVSAEKPDELARLLRLAEATRADLGDSLAKIAPTGSRPIGRKTVTEKP